jgi:nudix motif 8
VSIPAMIKDKPPTTKLSDAFSAKHLERIRKRLNRLPRQITKASDKRAAVVIPLCTKAKDGTPHIIFTLRSSSMRHHRGEVCFPGGMVDSADICIENTCLREMEEEVGVPRSQVSCDFN